MVVKKPVGRALAVMVTAVLVFTTLIGFSTSAQAVTNHEGTTSYTTEFFAYVKAGERMYITANGNAGATVLNEAGTAVKISGGYTPTAASTGVWRVTLRGSYSDRAAGFIYEVSVHAGTTERVGRVWIETDTILQNGVGDLNYFGVSDQGYIYQIKMHKTHPINATIALRSSGAAPNSQCNVQNKSIDSLSAYLDCGDKYRLFLDDPRKGGLPATAKMGSTTVPVLPTVVTSAQLNSSTKVVFSANADKPGGSFVVNSHAGFSGTAELQIDTNNNGSYTDSVDIEKEVVINRGKSAAWTWNGKNASGADVTAGAKARAVISKSGEAHLLLQDFEAFGGLTMTRLNGDSPNSIIRWDDSALVSKKGGSPTPVKTCLGGCNSNVSGGIHGWNEGNLLPGDTESRSWGDGRIIDNWAYVGVNAVSPAIALPALRTLSFNANGGTISGVTSIKRANGLTWGTLPTATKANNDFLGWYTATSGGTKLATNTVASSNLTAYARWQPTNRKLTFNANSGAINGVTSITKPHGAAWGTLPTATKANHDFLGWYTATSGGSQVTATTLAAGNITVYARWKVTDRKLTFDATGGAINGVTSITKPHGTAWGTLPTATKANHDFLGWYTAATGGTQVTASTVAAGNITAYARWQPTPRKLTFDATGGTISGVTSITKPHGTAWGALPTATATGKVFLGWYTAKSGGTQITATTLAAGSITAYAQWRPAKFNVVFYGNAQTGAVTGVTASIMVESGCTDCKLPANGFTKTTGAPALTEQGVDEKVEVNSKFLGWSLDPLSHKGDIADLAVAGALSQTDGATVKLYAIWDDAPKFIIESYPNRFFNLAEAKSGVVTEAELLSTVKASDKETNPLTNKTSDLVLSSGSDVGVTLFDYNAGDFTSLTDTGVVTVTYKVKDGVGNVAYLRIRVTVSDDATLGADAVQYLRGISPEYLDKGAGAGGLSEGSLWQTDPTRQTALTQALDGGAATTYCLDASAIAKMRNQVRAQGLGNSESADGLEASAAVLREEGTCS